MYPTGWALRRQSDRRTNDPDYNYVRISKTGASDANPKRAKLQQLACQDF